MFDVNNAILSNKCNFLVRTHENLIWLWCLTPLSTTYQLYFGKFYWWRKPEYTEKTIVLLQDTEKLYDTKLYPWAGFEFTTLVLIGTDCIGSCKCNYHTIMTMMAPLMKMYHITMSMDYGMRSISTIMDLAVMCTSG